MNKYIYIYIYIYNKYYANSINFKDIATQMKTINNNSHCQDNHDKTYKKQIRNVSIRAHCTFYAKIHGTVQQTFHPTTEATHIETEKERFVYTITNAASQQNKQATWKSNKTNT